MFILDGKPLPVDVPFSHNGINYPANWLRLTSWEEKEAIGISEVPDPEPVDTRFYWDAGIPKDLDQLKVQWTQQQDQTAYTMLAPTDWYVVRQTETGTETPVGITSYRAAVRNICKQRKDAIDVATDVPELIGITTFSGLDWPILPA
jgi:hypothetical protein